jgi:hypothetical protein
MGLRKTGYVRQHGRRKVAALDAQTVEHLRKPVGHRKIDFVCHRLNYALTQRNDELIGC